ncbi:MAG TPA: capsule assembly Wzi family protein [Sphingobacteriaceae bacterium]
MADLKKRYSLLVLFSFLFQFHSYAQSLSPGMVYDDLYRRHQLAGKLDPDISFTIRPLYPFALDFGELATSDHNFITGKELLPSRDGKLSFKLLPLSFHQRYYTLPYNTRNDGSMIPAKGYQAVISPGVFMRYGPLSVQFKPEYTIAANEKFDGKAVLFSTADLPSRFGGSTYSQVSWGQSSIRLNFDPVSIGLSNENIWWGPGIQNSLLMSNSASGFKHLTLNTTRPVKTPVGSFEAQLIGGRLEGSGYNPSLSDDWRYLSALAFSYQPRWVPGLFLGMSRSFQTYRKDTGSGFDNWFPLFQAFQKTNTTEDSVRRDQLVSVFARWLFKESKAEVYFEYGLNDHAFNFRDFLVAPEHARAYTLGFSKLVTIDADQDAYYQVAAEVTHMEQSIDRSIRDAGEWYTHYQVHHGYTNNGQVLGAGIGPGGNLQSLQISRVRGIDRSGIQLERYEHNGDLANAFGYRQWIDLSIGVFADRNYKNFILSGKLQGIQSYNYLWNDGINGRDKKNRFNINLDLKLLYAF